MAISVPFGLRARDRRPKPSAELGRELHVDEAGEAVGREQAALPRPGPDDRLVHDRAGLDLLVGPDPHVGVDRRPGADHDLAADHAALLEQASVLHRHRAADDGAAEARVLADVGVIPDDRVRDLRARVDGRVAADDARPVDPGARLHLGARADQGRAVDARARRDLGIGMDPYPLPHPLARDVDLDTALEAVEVRLDVGAMAADVLPVARSDPPEHWLALLEQLREHIARPVGRLARTEEFEDRRIQDVDACVGEVGDDLSPARLLDEPLDRTALVDDHHAVLERVGHRLEHDGGERAPLAVEAGGGGEVDVGEGIARDDYKRLGELRPGEHHRAGGAEGRVLDRVRERHALLGAIAEVVADRGAEVLHGGHHVAHLVAPQVQQDVLHDRPPGDRYQRFRLAAGQGAKTRSLAAGHDYRFHAPVIAVDTIVSRCWRKSTTSAPCSRSSTTSPTTCCGPGSRESKACSGPSMPNAGSRHARTPSCCSPSSARTALARQWTARTCAWHSKMPVSPTASTTTGARTSWTPRLHS